MADDRSPAAPGPASGARRRAPRPALGPRRPSAGGRLRIGDDWNAITIIALSQGNPLKAIAEFAENSIDARARTITIIRGKDRGEQYLRIIDDGEGIPRDASGAPDFRYVATHIGASLKRQLKEKGAQGIQGEFGIGLLSFWTVGERLALSCAGADGRTHVMEMERNRPGYTLSVRRALFAHPGTELLVRPLLPGLRQLSGEKIQSYLASELRDRIRSSGVRIRILDRAAKKDLEVQPRQFTGRLLHQLPAAPTPGGEVYVELYLGAQGPQNQVSLFRQGTRVLQSITELEQFDREPWNAGFLQGIVDAPFLQLTPGTRSGVILDHSYQLFRDAMAPVEAALRELIDQERRAGEEQASRDILNSVRRAFREAFLALPPEEYDWFGIQSALRRHAAGRPSAEEAAPELPAPGAAGESPESALVGETPAEVPADAAADREPPPHRDFFEFPGPLHGAVIVPGSPVVRARSETALRCVPRDKSRRVIEHDVSFTWRVVEGEGRLASFEGEMVRFLAAEEPGLAIVEAAASQGKIVVTARSLITVSETLVEREPGPGEGRGKGLPGYTYQRAPGELWRSRFDEKNNLVVINNGHRDYVYASQKHARKVRYICRLFAKELVLANFPGFDSAELLERMIELSMYTEEHLK